MTLMKYSPFKRLIEEGVDLEWGRLNKTIEVIETVKSARYITSIEAETVRERNMIPIHETDLMIAMQQGAMEVIVHVIEDNDSETVMKIGVKKIMNNKNTKRFRGATCVMIPVSEWTEIGKSVGMVDDYRQFNRLWKA